MGRLLWLVVVVTAGGAWVADGKTLADVKRGMLDLQRSPRRYFSSGSSLRTCVVGVVWPSRGTGHGMNSDFVCSHPAAHTGPHTSTRSTFPTPTLVTALRHETVTRVVCDVCWRRWAGGCGVKLTVERLICPQLSAPDWPDPGLSHPPTHTHAHTPSR
jgi:hypothetical protein